MFLEHGKGAGGMREKWIDAGILLAAACLLAALCLCFGRESPAPLPELPPVRSVSGDGVLLRDGEARIDINTAGAGLLMELPGVGEATAQSIIEHRAQHGPFSCGEDLLAVKGIGPAKLEQLLPYIGFE